MQQSKLMETWVGIFVALGLVSMFFLAMQVSNLADVTSYTKGYRVTARFQNVGGLKVRATVSMAGVRVGRVSAIGFDKESYEAVVEMLIEPEFDTIPNDTTASILTLGLLGEQYVSLSAGGSEEYLKNGDKIDLTQSAMVLEQVISRFLFNKAESGGQDKQEAAPVTGNSEVPSQPASAEDHSVEKPVEQPVQAPAEKPADGGEAPAAPQPAGGGQQP